MVKVYTPDEGTEVTEEEGDDPAGVPNVGPVQEYVTPDVPEEPLMVADVAEQVMVWEPITLISGILVLLVTEIIEYDEHPLIGSVVVKV